MSTRELDQIAERPAAVPVPVSISQSTAIEQARAAAEVQAAVVVAQNVPRRLDEAIAKIREACNQLALADRAFYRYNRGGKQVTGPNVHLARELKRCFGNMQSGVDELRRDDEAGMSEVRAWAWDVEQNSRQSRTLIVPHARDVEGGGRRKLTALRDIQEMIANQGARAERETILALLPEWYVELATAACNETLKRGGGDKPLTERIADTIKSYADTYGVNRAQLEDKLGRNSSDWTPQDLATLRVIWTSLSRGEVTRQEEFPQRRVTAEEIAGQATATPAGGDAAQGSGESDAAVSAAGQTEPAAAEAGRAPRTRRPADAKAPEYASGSEPYDPANEPAGWDVKS